jgi:uncharacterized protein (TIGR03435 family)
MHLRRTLTLLAAASLSLATTTRAQSTTTPSPTAVTTPAFDVVSIKPAKPGATGTDSNFYNEAYTATNVTLKEILEYDAYDIPASEILGIPPALASPAFDIEAKMDPAVYAQMKTLSHDQFNIQFQQMVQQLLADRFKLAVHPETRELPIYALVVAKNGPNLQPAKNPDGGTSMSSRTGQLTAKGATVAQLAQKLTRSLESELGRIVIDQTNLTGKYDLTLKWTPAMGSPPMLNGQLDTSAPDIFTAVQEQLGLKLESTKGPVPVLVVDHAELPSEN